MNADTRGAAIARVQRYMLGHIPLARAMDLSIARYSGTELEMSAPLAPNRNDKGCAFGGSMASLLTLAGWALLELGLRAEGLGCDTYIGDSQIRYREPVWGELRGSARFAAGSSLHALVAALRARSKGHVDLVCAIAGTNAAAATLRGRFFAKLRA